VDKASSDLERSALQNLVDVADAAANLVTSNIGKATWTSLQQDVSKLIKHNQQVPVHTARRLTQRYATDLLREGRYELWIATIWPCNEELVC
jgi:hypothetical protein